MKEELLQYAWKHQLIEKQNFKTTAGEQIEVLNPGRWNSDSGPDFFNANIKIGDTIWAGNVEVHVKASDWFKHNHHNDEAYSNVILHVVAEDDGAILIDDKRELATFVIQIDERIDNNYQQLIQSESKPACSAQILQVDPIYIRLTLESMLIERIQNKTQIIEGTLKANKEDWNQTFYHYLGMNFGFKLNALPFEILTRNLPLRVVAHHTQNLSQTEALLFGQSGMLNEELLGDDYFINLRNEYSYLANKYKLKGMEPHLWKFLRLRPANFPSVRISQFAHLLYKSRALFSQILETESVNKLIELFDVRASEYWDSHYRFNMPSPKRVKKLGAGSKNNLLINTIVPFLYLYGERNNKLQLKQRAFELLEALPSEQNNILTMWSQLGLKSTNAYDSQALIQLKNVYCDNKKCLNCQIGNKVINR